MTEVMQNSPSLNNMGGVAPNNKPADQNPGQKSIDHLGPKVFLPDSHAFRTA
jgi:hypothetical protein